MNTPFTMSMKPANLLVSLLTITILSMDPSNPQILMGEEFDNGYGGSTIYLYPPIDTSSDDGTDAAMEDLIEYIDSELDRYDSRDD